jgi:hypothetical protein
LSNHAAAASSSVETLVLPHPTGAQKEEDPATATAAATVVGTNDQPNRGAGGDDATLPRNA